MRSLKLLLILHLVLWDPLQKFSFPVPENCSFGELSITIFLLLKISGLLMLLGLVSLNKLRSGHISVSVMNLLSLGNDKQTRLTSL